MSAKRRLPVIQSIDGLRGIAALMVMVFHYFQTHPSHGGSLETGLQQLAVVGNTGVDLFFVLSGFLITRILLVTREREDYWSSFYVRRSLRIFPLYFLGLALFYFVGSPLMKHAIPDFRQQCWYWTYLQNVPETFPGLKASGPAHFWSLAVEEHFYLIWPAVVLATPLPRMAAICYTIVGAAIVSRVVLLSTGFIVYYFTPCRMDALAIGALLAVWEHTGLLHTCRKRLAWTGLSLAILLSLLVMLVGNRVLPAVESVRYSVWAAFYACIVGVASTTTSSKMALLSSTPFRCTGKISYGLYVFHPFVYHLADCISMIAALPTILNLVVKIAATFLVATMSYVGFEMWFLRLKDRLSSPTVEGIAARLRVGGPPSGAALLG